MEKEELLKGYEKILLIRRLEEALVKYYYDNRIMSFVHFSLGQESVSAGTCQNLIEGDLVFGNHRSHALAISMDIDLGRFVAELLGKKEGVSGGAGGSMHQTWRKTGLVGTTPLLGAAVPLAAGGAFAINYNQKKNASICFLGDGASEEGCAIFETCNLAATFNLPLVIILENNSYSVMTTTEQRRGKNYDLQKIVEGLSCYYIWADGNDFKDVYKKTQIALTRSRENKECWVVECFVTREMAHSAPIKDDHKNYRKEGDLSEDRSKKDNVINLRKSLELTVPLEDLEEIELKVEQKVKEAMEFGINSK